MRAKRMGTFETSLEALINSITPELHQALKTAVELGRWANGERLSPEQIELCLQAVIAWDARNLPEQHRVAYIDRSGLRKEKCDD
ncbi:MAG: DUF1315 family protein [Pseudomonadales bacterium]|nr:DUF1315 family protein [Pseudomonadales bacterium]